ncbi:MAG: Na/Pi symporter [Acidimicrobiia bacterium]|nr:Na/Pi symporter [Acidimicrobiia bacterium]NNL70272.1 Na/Pi symporter [Acidimicrobiia bacterium]
MALSQPTTKPPLPTWARLLLVFGLLYTFLAGVKFLESGIKAFGSDVAADLFDGISNPLAGLFAGILATVLVQSSSVTTATIVGLVGSGTLPFDTAVPMIMGANIGTTVTNTLASLGHIRRSQEFERAFAGATMHDFFNLMAVSVLLPLELLTGFLSGAAEEVGAWLSDAGIQGGELGDSPLKSAVKWPVDQTQELLDGLGDNLLGAVLLMLGLGLIFLSLAFITKNMKEVLAGRIERSINEVLSRGGGVPAMLLGLVITVAVQSSSITTSILIPIIAAGVLTLRNAYPITLGANVGTTVTALLASLAADRPEALAIALTHTAFNLAGIVLFYPLPQLRHLPVRAAERLAHVALTNRTLALGYVVGVFIVVPLIGIVLLR